MRAGWCLMSCKYLKKWFSGILWFSCSVSNEASVPSIKVTKEYQNIHIPCFESNVNLGWKEMVTVGDCLLTREECLPDWSLKEDSRTLVATMQEKCIKLDISSSFSSCVARCKWKCFLNWNRILREFLTAVLRSWRLKLIGKEQFRIEISEGNELDISSLFVFIHWKTVIQFRNVSCSVAKYEIRQTHLQALLIYRVELSHMRVVI